MSEVLQHEDEKQHEDGDKENDTPIGRPEARDKIVIHSAGSYDKLGLEQEDVPPLTGDEVLIEVEAAGINYADTLVRMGLYESAKEYVGWPITPGFEVAGRVIEVGPEVDDLQVGQEVCAVSLFDGYTSHLVTRRPYIFDKPDSMSFAQAAGLPTVFITAWYALFELAHPREGSTVLVHSAAGGVGGSLVQLAKIAGCEVVGVVGGTHKIETAQYHGADHVIDKSKQNLWDEAERIAPDGYDLILDANGVATLSDSYDHLRRAGKLVIYGFHTMMPKKGGKPNWLKLISGWLRTPRFNPINMTNESKSVLAFNLSYLFDRIDILTEAVEDLQRWLDDDLIKPAPVSTYPLDEVGRAHADIESGRTVGKLILIPGQQTVPDGNRI
jgi:NADPH:quinone reductase-like Zn-dependent oxidoreductase